MAKNWLIRTKSNHILGPVSKEKVVELYSNGSIKPDDEICSGNGYWFFIRETDLIDKYLLGDGIQSFNPISEAKDILTGNETLHSNKPETVSEDITLITPINLTGFKEDVPTKELPKEKDLISPPEGNRPIDLAEKKNSKKRKVALMISENPHQKQSYLKQLGLIAFFILVLAIYFRKSILKSFFQGGASLAIPQSIILNNAYAEEQALVSKKKSLIHQ